MNIIRCVLHGDITSMYENA